MQKAEKIKYLWRTFRNYTKARILTRKMNKMAAHKSDVHLVGVDIDDQSLSDDKKEEEDHLNRNYKWYMINQNNKIPKIWNIFMEWVTIYCFFSHPFMYIKYLNY